MKSSGIYCPILFAVTMFITQNVYLVNAQEMPKVKQWQVCEVEMTATQSEANPYVAFL